MAFFKGYAPERRAPRPSAWTLFKEGLAEGAGRALVEAPIRFGTEVAVDYVAPTRRREREHMGKVEKLQTREQVEKERSNLKAEELASEAARAAAQKTADYIEQKERASRRRSRAFVTRPEVSMPAAADALESTETPLPEIRPVVAPPARPLPSDAQGLLDTFKAGAASAQAREAEQGFAPAETAPKAAALDAESVGYQQLRRQDVQPPAVEPEFGIDEPTGLRTARGFVSERPEAVREAIVIPGSVDTAFDIALTQARTEKEKSLSEKARRQATGGGKGGGGGVKVKPYSAAEMNATDAATSAYMTQANLKRSGGENVTWQDVKDADMAAKGAIAIAAPAEQLPAAGEGIETSASARKAAQETRLKTLATRIAALKQGQASQASRDAYQAASLKLRMAQAAANRFDLRTAKQYEDEVAKMLKGK